MAAGSIEHEGPDMGVGDFVLLSEITMNAFIKNLKLRFDFSFKKPSNMMIFLVLKKDESIHILARFVN